MADATTVVEGKIKFREGKKWKPRWCILKKPSPVADQLQVVLYKDVTQAVKDEAKPKNTFVLEAFFGLDAGVTFDKEPHVLAVICQKTTILMGFEQREQMIQFEIKIRQSLGEEHQFPVTVVKAPSSSRLLKEQVRLVIHDLRFCLIAQTPPKILLSWNIEDLRRFGTNENKFCFEGGSRCGKGTGVFALQSEQAKDIEDIVHLASIGKMSNGYRKSKIRSSQVDLSTHLIADILPSHSSSYIHHHHQNTGSKSPPQAPLPVTLNCCYDNQTGSAESEDWSWYKRHSVSVMDHHRIVVSRDNNMDHFMGIYDVPPNHGRRLADNIGDGQEEPNYAVPRTYLESAQPGSPQNSNNDYSNCNKKRSIDGHAEDQNRFKGADDGFTLRVNDTARKSPSPSASREESLQRLKMQESDLQREMVLLDEILQNCAAKNQEKVFELDKNDQTSTERKSSKSHKSPLTSLDDHLTIISGNISPFSIKLENPQAPKRTERVMAERLNTSMPEQMPSRPLCKRKSKNILAPLPYVNLSRYDDESYSHVHLPGSSDSIPIARDSNHMGLDVKQVRLRGQSSSLINLTHASAHQVSGRHSSEAVIESFCPTCKFTTLTLPIDVIPRNNEESHTYVWSQRTITTQNISDISECNHPAKTILRPRSGHEYVVIKRKAKLLATSHLNSASGKVFTFDPEHHDTLSVLSSLSTPQNSPHFSSAEGTIRSLYPDSWLLQSFAATPSPCPSLKQRCPQQPSSASYKTHGAEKHFGPTDLHFPFTLPPSPYHHKPWSSQQVHYPIYVNQEFAMKQPQSSSSVASSSSVSPVQFSALFSPKPNSCSDCQHNQQKRNHSLRHSDPDPCKFANFQFSLTSSQGVTTEYHLSKEPTHCPDLLGLEKNRGSKKEYDKFTESSIISRRRNQLPAPFSEVNETESSSISTSNLTLQIPQVKSSGYKNIDSLNAAAAVVSSTHSFTLPRGMGMHGSRVGTSQNDITKYQHELKALSTSDSSSTFSSDTLHLYNPPPPIRLRHASTSSSSSSPSSSPCLTPVYSSDSPPSYYAPSPPYTPPAVPPLSLLPPAIPPRQRLLPPAPQVVPSSPSDRTTDTSEDDEQELNYIEVDMTKASGEPSPRPQTVYYRPSKRMQKKERDSAKLRYVLIDHSATKALQQARQEHVQARDGTQIKSTSQLNRINSAPASSKKKHFTFISRERKLSSGSVESC